MSTSAIGGTTWTYNGLVLPAEKGERPRELDAKKLIETRAIQMKDGWVGQIIMAGEIVHETATYPDSDDDDGSKAALEAVNQRIFDAFKRLVVDG